MMLSLFSILFMTNHPIRANAGYDVWRVPTDFPSIQAAINNATPGDTILVGNGTYFENLVINKTVSLIGQGPTLTTVDGREIGSVFNITSDNVVVRGFSIRKSAINPFSSAINIDSCNECRISDNRIFDSYDGITLHSSTGNTISNNTILNNFYTGISLYFSTGNIISENVVKQNYDGVNFYSSSDNVVAKNFISDSYTGMSLYSSSSNLITGNVVSLSSYYGLITAIYSNNNTIYHNNFNNTNQVFVSDSVNTWNFSGEGNYWARSILLDLNKDGIGDTTYSLDANNIDYHPLMGAFTAFTVFAQEETHDVEIISNSSISDLIYEIGVETGNRMIRFDAAGEKDSIGFCRIKIPAKLMNYTPIVLAGEEEIDATLFNMSESSHVCMYFTYVHSNRTISIISSKALHLFNQLMSEYLNLQNSFLIQNETYNSLLKNHTELQGNYSKLEESYNRLNASFQEYLLIHTENMINYQNLIYIFAAATAIFLGTTVYLSRRTEVRNTSQSKETNKN